MLSASLFALPRKPPDISENTLAVYTCTADSCVHQAAQSSPVQASDPRQRDSQRRQQHLPLLEMLGNSARCPLFAFRCIASFAGLVK